MIVQLFRPEGGGDKWLLYAPDLPGGIEGIVPTPELERSLEGASGYYNAEPRDDGQGWRIVGRADDPNWG